MTATPGIVVRVDGTAGRCDYSCRCSLCLGVNGTGELFLSAGARADLAAYSTMEARAGRETQQRIEKAGHAAG